MYKEDACSSITSFIMSDEKGEIRAILCYLWKKGLSAKAAAEEINDVEGPGTVDEHMAQKWFRRFKECNISLKDKPRSGRPSVVGDETLLEVIEQPSTSTRMLSAELDPSQVPHELTNDQTHQCVKKTRGKREKVRKRIESERGDSKTERNATREIKRKHDILSVYSPKFKEESYS
ncbi:histone-lysine N-methyltransferase SETMAR-like isoform X2 [Octopus bimaculoides]|uniref:histone-lysine N-methyltransferase SETMAR-like isoform X2 n=1 Tax=Octopus bimaculoides TaxID=37653 RepID=UPI0022E92584|nr:histone-lysine N-methyltransferase SETMAR-like isoform X2 [Octopus bimaculoides]